MYSYKYDYNITDFGVFFKYIQLNLFSFFRLSNTTSFYSIQFSSYELKLSLIISFSLFL